jgi:hypothetical protein
MTDTVDRILTDLRARRDELRPLVTELERVEAAIDALERADGEAPNGRRGRSAAAPAANPATGRRRGRPRKGEPNRADQFLALVRRGAISIPDAARELGIGPNYLYRIAGTLEGEGTIKKAGREYVLAVPSPSEPSSTGDLVTQEGVNEGTSDIVSE